MSEKNFDPITFLDQLIEKMGMQNEDPQKIAELKEVFGKILHDQLFDAAARHINPDLVDQALQKETNQNNWWALITELIKNSPAAQEAMAKAIEKFEERVLKAHKNAG